MVQSSARLGACGAGELATSMTEYDDVADGELIATTQPDLLRAAFRHAFAACTPLAVYLQTSHDMGLASCDSSPSRNSCWPTLTSANATDGSLGGVPFLLTGSAGAWSTTLTRCCAAGGQKGVVTLD
jgi:hypothetical protein